MKEVTEDNKITLNKKELLMLINIVGEVSVPVKQSSTFVDLINKMSKMIDGLK